MIPRIRPDLPRRLTRFVCTTPPPAPTSTATRTTLRLALLATAFFTIGYTTSYLLPHPMLHFHRQTALPLPNSADESTYLHRLRTQVFTSTLVARLQSDPAWKMEEGFSEHGMEMAAEGRMLTEGALGGVGRLSGRWMWVNDGTHEVVAVAHLGPQLCGFPSITHGGLLATLLDETLGRVAISAFPAGKSVVTASLDIKYKAPTMVDQVVVIKGNVKAREGEGERRVRVEGRVEALEGGAVFVGCEGVFAVPRRPLPR
ncbi:Thioesterase/thiol ester dehydrase-isomerase [Saitoella complicata NRRL Y-17804]|uniref:Thioesterase/thiol ester dehydrase-isomerase n=1 Tax=Saitoella complicata (strain BCRC 22490 / CBS 7301 / JCM 7358 / NBRC 10748 / NRRL Y-17804) TaxID=698492 RepID=UPI000867B73D|nr:Thioesterase/thiol ester dehydrase-isomerase [Saitoella complicata NRRL Y-17804]ODQ56295.1 Thioesterase/thiol ester dehydrase-isomerase [Saitoella complicata NRRL Y-17804]